MNGLNSGSSLFYNITQEDLDQIYHCLRGRKKSFESGETITSFGKDDPTIGIMASGVARLERVNYFGECSLLDRMEKNDIFGESIVYADYEDSEISAVCEKNCEVIFVDHDRLIHPCEKACDCHMTMMENLLQIMANKSVRLSRRVEVLSNKSIRNKLMAFFALQAKDHQSDTFELPFSVSALADFICVDRSAMMREISKMKKEGIIRTDRRKITLL